MGLAAAVVLLSGLGAGPTRGAADQRSVASEATVRPAIGKRVRANRETTIYWSPAAQRPRRAIVQEGSVVELAGGPAKSGSGCRAGWLAVSGGGYLCSDTVEPTHAPVRRVPHLIDGLLPFVFVHRIESKAYSYAFLPEGDRGEARLVRRGKVLDKARYALHEPSRFQGRDLEKRPVADAELVPGWTVVDDTPLFGAPSPAARPLRRLARHTPLLVGRRPAAKGWREVRTADGKRALGFMKEDGKLRFWVAAPSVKGLAKGETWLDIDVGQQMVALQAAGTGPVYITLISSGLAARPTPMGVYRVQHKIAYRSMGHLPGTPDPYFIENIPWALYFLPNYAVHAAYWHNELGNRRSHGCVNLAPRDARHIYERLPPAQQPGFFKTFASDQAAGAVVRVRDSARVTANEVRTRGHDRRQS